MSERDDIDALAAEYVLGTLDAAERRDVDARRLREPMLASAIRAWEQRFIPLTTTVEPVAPPAALFAKIERRISLADADVSAPSDANRLTPIANIVHLERRLARWRTAAISASALAASLGLLAVFRDQILPPQPQSFVAAFVKNDELPQFMLTIDLATRELTIRPVGADRLQGKTYQLWIASDRIGPAPRSLGVLDDGSTPLQRKSLEEYDRSLLQNATFGVSIEQAGGSTTGQPSPGALHAKLVPAKP